MSSVVSNQFVETKETHHEGDPFGVGMMRRTNHTHTSDDRLGFNQHREVCDDALTVCISMDSLGMPSARQCKKP